MRPLHSYDYRAIARNLVIDPTLARLAPLLRPPLDRVAFRRLADDLARSARLVVLLPVVLLWALAIASLFALREVIDIWSGSDSVIETLLRDWFGRR